MTSDYSRGLEFRDILVKPHRLIGNVCYDRQQRSYDWSYAWSRDQQRLEKIVRLVVAINDRSYDRSCPPTIDRMINSVGRRASNGE